MRAGRSSRAGFSGRFHGPIFAGRSSRGGFKGRSLQAGLHGARCSEGKEVNGRRDCGQGGPLRAAPCFGLTFRIVPYIGFFLFRAAPHFGPSPDPACRALPMRRPCSCVRRAPPRPGTPPNCWPVFWTWDTCGASPRRAGAWPACPKARKNWNCSAKSPNWRPLARTCKRRSTVTPSAESSIFRRLPSVAPPDAAPLRVMPMASRPVFSCVTDELLAVIPSSAPAGRPDSDLVESWGKGE